MVEELWDCAVWNAIMLLWIFVPLTSKSVDGCTPSFAFV